jgi:hypothetical protein
MLNFWVMTGSFRDTGYRCLLATDITLFAPYVANALDCQGVSIVQEFVSSESWARHEDINVVYSVEYYSEAAEEYEQLYATDLAQLQWNINHVKELGDAEPTVTTHQLMRPYAPAPALTSSLGEILKKVCAANPLD